MASDKIWISRKGSVYGPYNDSSLQKYCRDGVVKHSDLIWTSEKQEWAKLEDYPKFFGDDSIKSQNIPNHKIMNKVVEENFSSKAEPLKSFGSFIIHPIVCKDIAPNDERFGSAIENLKMEANSGFVSESPVKELKRGNLDRWLHKEPRALFRRDSDEDIEEKYLKSPRIGWINWEKPAWEKKEGVYINHFGLLDPAKRDAEYYMVWPWNHLPRLVRWELFLLSFGFFRKMKTLAFRLEMAWT